MNLIHLSRKYILLSRGIEIVMFNPSERAWTGPGTIDTPMVSVQDAEREALYDKMTQNNLISRGGTADEVAEGIMFVIKNEFVTGTTVDVDGGWFLS
jgi:NAD(P)-dependent dehydrogenase (short-subunit alcohol dehydrogenase family)